MADTTITGLEADLLLWALDEACMTDHNGKCTIFVEGHELEFCQAVRDKLFAAHEHPPEGDDWSLEPCTGN